MKLTQAQIFNEVINRLGYWDGCDDIIGTVQEGIYCKGCKHEELCRELTEAENEH